MEYKDVPCRWCGQIIRWVPGGVNGEDIPVENKLVPYKRRADGRGITLYTGEGGRIQCDQLPESRAREADGFARRYHFCAKRPVTYKAPTWREQQREEYREFRAAKAAEG